MRVLLTADQIVSKTNGLKRGEIPLDCSHLTMFVDVQGNVLFYLIAAWTDQFTGYVIEYGTEPDQKQPGDDPWLFVDGVCGACGKPNAPPNTFVLAVLPHGFAVTRREPGAYCDRVLELHDGRFTDGTDTAPDR